MYVQGEGDMSGRSRDIGLSTPYRIPGGSRTLHTLKFDRDFVESRGRSDSDEREVGITYGLLRVKGISARVFTFGARVIYVSSSCLPSICCQCLDCRSCTVSSS